MSKRIGDEVVAPHARVRVAGSVHVPPSKSLTQRALLAAALAGEGARVANPLDAEDPRLLAAALAAAGWELAWETGEVRAGDRREIAGATISMGNNGTGARFMLAQLAATPGTWLLDGSPRLRERPFAGLVRALRSLGAEITPLPPRTPPSAIRSPQSGPRSRSEPRLPLRVAGRELQGGEVEIDPSSSSQFASALMLLGARLGNGLVVRLVAPPPSQPYIGLTAEVLEAFGGEVTVAEGGRVLAVRGGGLTPARFVVEGDWSAAAFPLAAAAVAGGEVEVIGVREGSRQGDARIVELLVEAGCRVRYSSAGVQLSGAATRALSADLRDTPDLFPALAVIVAVVGGELAGLAGLGMKESNRLQVMRRHLNELGLDARVQRGRLLCRGGLARALAPPVPLSPAADHRIAMALAVAGTVIPGVRIADPGCVAKSWPDFWRQWHELMAVGA